MSKKCVIFNYVPNSTPRIVNYDIHFEKWYEFYKHYLLEMYDITMNLIKEQYEDINIDSKHNFDIFMNLIYNSSSKYISKD